MAQLHTSLYRLKNQSGITLTEITITLLLVAIFAGIAYPNYQEAILKARRAEAKSALYSVLLHQERYYLQQGTYAEFNAATANSPFKWWSADAPATSHYEISAAACAEKNLDECILLTATPGTENVLAGNDPVCGNLMLDSTNNKSTSMGTDPDSVCW